jgi:hypothetical protein
MISAMKKAHKLPSLAASQVPPAPPPAAPKVPPVADQLDRDGLASVPAQPEAREMAAPPLPADPTIRVRSVEPHWHAGVFHDRKSEYSLPLSEARALGHLVARV